MKTIHEYEPADIVIDEGSDPIHRFLFAQFLVLMLTGPKPRPDDPPDQPLLPLQRLVANFLNAAQKEGISIAKGEAVPEVFRR